MIQPTDQLNYLISCIDNPFIKSQLYEWVKANIVEVGRDCHVSNAELEYIKNNAESYFDYQKDKVALQLGRELLDKAAAVKVYTTPYSQVTQYKIYAIKWKDEK